MTTPRLPRKCARVSAELARELGKPWPPVRRAPEIITAPKHFEQHKTFQQTGERA